MRSRPWQFLVLWNIWKNVFRVWRNMVSFPSQWPTSAIWWEREDKWNIFVYPGIMWFHGYFGPWYMVWKPSINKNIFLKECFSPCSSCIDQCQTLPKNQVCIMFSRSSKELSRSNRAQRFPVSMHRSVTELKRKKKCLEFFFLNSETETTVNLWEKSSNIYSWSPFEN